jgi:signal transduction histidine kinase
VYHSGRSAAKLSFEADAAIIDRLGRELVAKQETALIELVKNAFDADATKTDVVLHGRSRNATLEIRDNGAGMTREELVNGFLRLASDLKVQTPISPTFGRQRAGRKGIGRFATQRLGYRLRLTTYAGSGKSAYRLTIEWDKFVPGATLQDIPVKLEEVLPGGRGTTVRIEGLRDEWSDAQIRQAWEGVLALQQPFPVAQVRNRPTADPGFKVRFLRKSEVLHDETLIADLQTEILDHLHAVIELEVDKKGNARWQLSKNRFGPTRTWSRIHHEHPESTNPPRYAHLRDAWMKSYYAILNPTLFPRLVGTRVRDVVSQQGGIRLYRNNFRVIPYGSPDNDWLRLDELYAKRSFLAPIGNRNFFGVVEVRDPAGKLFEEHTSREGLIETPAFLELKELVSAALVTAVTRISEDRGRKTKAGQRSQGKQATPTDLGEVNAAVKAAQESADTAVRDGKPAQAQAAAQQAAAAARLVEAARAQLADEAVILRFLATLGMTMAEFSHETGMTFEAFRLDFESVFEAAVAAHADEQPFKSQADRARGMLVRLDTLTSYLNALAGARAARGMRPISLSKGLQDFEKGMRAQAESRHIVLDVKTPPYDPLFTRPMHEAEIASALLNFYTNAVKALKRAGGRRAILVEADRLREGASERVRVRFSDTGDGIPEDIRDKIFDPFFTTRIAPPAGASEAEHATGAGLGLWIVRQIAVNAGGEVYVSNPPDGYSTCFELTLPPEAGAEDA